MQIRAAEPADWPTIWPTFQEIVTAGETYAYPEHLTSAEAEALWLEPAPSHAAVMVDEEAVVGTAKMGPNRPGRGAHAMPFNAVVETNHAAVGLWTALGFHIIGTAPEAFDSRRHGLVGLHVMHRPLGG